jgi:aryl-alcohol dehydrogenase-like predicted oxidoreductase
VPTELVEITLDAQGILVLPGVWPRPESVGTPGTFSGRLAASGVLWLRLARQYGVRPAPAAHRLHRPLPGTPQRPRHPLEETLEALLDLVRAGKVRYLGASSMPAWEFAKALRLQREHGWARFVSMQDHYNLLHREEEREMIPRCLDEDVGTIIWSPLARGRLARAWDDAKSTARAETDGAFADMLYSPTEEASKRAIVDAVGQVAEAHGVSRAQIALAWLRRQPVVTAPLVGAGSVQQTDDAVASLDVELTDEQVRALIAPYTSRYDWQGISDEAELDAIRARVPGMTLR